MGHCNPVKCIYLFNILRKHLQDAGNILIYDHVTSFIITIQRTTSIDIQRGNAASLLRTFPVGVILWRLSSPISTDDFIFTIAITTNI